MLKGIRNEGEIKRRSVCIGEDGSTDFEEYKDEEDSRGYSSKKIVGMLRWTMEKVKYAVVAESRSRASVLFCYFVPKYLQDLHGARTRAGPVV